MPSSDAQFPVTPVGFQKAIQTFAIRLAAGMLLANLIILCLVILFASHLRHEREERARISSKNISHILVDNINGVFDKINIVLLSVADETERQLKRGGIDNSAMNTFMARHRSRIPETDNLLMADVKGNVIFQAVALNKTLNVADREFFATLRDHPSERLYISKPLVSRVTNKWLVVVARRVNRPDGSFIGVVWSTLSIDYFSRLFAPLNIGKHGGISLRDAEMGIIARHPAPKEIGSIIGNKTLSPELRKLFEAGLPEGTFFTPSSWDNTAKIVSYRKVGAYPLYINVGVATKDYLAGWQQDYTKLLLLALCYGLFTLLLSLALFIGYKRVKLAEINLYILNGELEQRVVERTAELRQKNGELEKVLARVKQLEGIIPICMYCKNIRDDKNSWQRLETYISDHSEALFSHGICPSCAEKIKQ